jgi:hypothetical protein
MTREQLEHILRAAGAITGRNEWVLVGSQAILGAVANAPKEITVSEELDLYAPGDKHASDLIDGRLTELNDSIAARIRTRLRSASIE